MKKIKSIFLSAIICIASIALVFQSCNNDNGVSSSDSTNKAVANTQYEYLDLPIVYKQVGEYHNNGMDTCYVSLKNEFKKLIVEAKVKNIKDPLSPKYLLNFDFETVGNKTSLKYSNNGKEFKYKLNECQKVKSKDYKKIKFNDNVNYYLDKIHSIVKDKDAKDDIKIMKNKLNEINKKAVKNLNEEDLRIVYCATSTAFSSYQYWNKNLEKWYTLLNAEKWLKSSKKSMKQNVRQKSGWVEDANGSWSYMLDDVIIYGDNYEHHQSFAEFVYENRDAILWADVCGAATGAWAGATISWNSGMLFIPGVGLEAGAATTLTSSASYAIEGSFMAMVGCGVDEWRRKNGYTF